MILQKDAENSVDVGSTQRGRLKKILTKGTLIKRIRQRQLCVLEPIIRTEGLANFTLTGHIEGKKNRQDSCECICEHGEKRC